MTNGTTGSTLHAVETARTVFFSSEQGLRAREKVLRAQTSAVGSLTSFMCRTANNREAMERIQDWIPVTMKTQRLEPESLSTLGRPWLWSSSEGSLRLGPLAWPAWGVGQFAFALSGGAVVLMFNGQ